ncbi:PREDICTED: uncharacterized protein LOC106107961 [Papilio polytes]|uniref:uncharacterized protein LOC106107961 n=1 Tax=Papilio polytes TaxID=76194 RepID=UPI00067697D5|nr:PREDICTED: uncharacterized protein LOC106107961 [Papilio polytes]
MKYTHFLIFHFVIVYAGDLAERTVNNRDQYKNILKTVPVLLEHLIDILQYKPQILEKDDIKIFTIESPRKYDIDNKKDFYITNKKEIKTSNDHKKLSHKEANYSFYNTSEHIKKHLPVVKKYIVKKDVILNEMSQRKNSNNYETKLSKFCNESNYYKNDFATNNKESAFVFTLFNNTDVKARIDDVTTNNFIPLTAEKIIEMTFAVETRLEEYNKIF